MDELSSGQIVGKTLTVPSPNNGPAISGHSNKRTSYFSQNQDLPQKFLPDNQRETKKSVFKKNFFSIFPKVSLNFQYCIFNFH